MVVIQEHATGHNLTVCRTYADEGVSGLEIKNRPGLRKLVLDVLRRAADLSMVLAYDIARWARV